MKFWRSCHRLARDIPNIAYLIVGDGSDRARLEQKARELGVEERVIFAGAISEGEKPDPIAWRMPMLCQSRRQVIGIV